MIKTKTIRFTKLLMAAAFLIVGIGTTPAQAAYYFHANGGSYWTQSGSGWWNTNDDGYCVSERGPCGSQLWYFQSNMNHYGCGLDAWGDWEMAAILPYDGVTAAWIDGLGGGTMWGASYTVAYNYASGSYLTVNQNNYWEEFAPLDTRWRTSNVDLTDGCGPLYACNGVDGLRVEFDEVRLDV